MRRMRSKAAFTLIEMLVVMGIAATLVAITIPIARNLSQGNKGLRCASKLQHISQALKMYALDEGSVPAYYPTSDLAGGMEGQGLRALFFAGYLPGEEGLHCPSDRDHVKGQLPSQQYFSYYSPDDDAMTDGSTLYGGFNRYKYMSCRGVRRGSADLDVRRQLTPLPPSPSASLVPETSRDWHPDDTTVVIWCNYHFKGLKRADEGQYQVLFWDGSVRKMPGYLFQDGDPVAEAWRVRPTDDDTP